MTSPTAIINLFNDRRAKSATQILDEAIVRAEREYDDVTLIDMLRAAKRDVRDMARAWPEMRRWGG
jgi:hypothetical protein